MSNKLQTNKSFIYLVPRLCKNNILNLVILKIGKMLENTNTKNSLMTTYWGSQSILQVEKRCEVKDTKAIISLMFGEAKNSKLNRFDIYFADDSASLSAAQEVGIVMSGQNKMPVSISPALLFEKDGTQKANPLFDERKGLVIKPGYSSFRGIEELMDDGFCSMVADGIRKAILFFDENH